MPRRPKIDPLMAALIAKLPPAGSDWPVDQQAAWLRLMAMAFGTVYGGEVIFTGKPVASVPIQPKAKPSIGHPFLIDEGGFVRNAKTHKRVSPDQVDGSIFDARGQDGDMRTIIWADNSTGVNGKDFVISA